MTSTKANCKSAFDEKLKKIWKTYAVTLLESTKALICTEWRREGLESIDQPNLYFRKHLLVYTLSTRKFSSQGAL